MYQAYPPFLRYTGGGAVRFTYGARTVFAGSGLDESEGRLIVDRLRGRLPASAFAGGGAMA